ncbi:homoserine kinase [Paenibacillus sp. KQZ6P-2]|uniref:Homoserine kinase n=1 Tax=Paenibacillus mangrovi TaxID=2931978 RepID=A0A9X1WSJ6_9BACL|nr:homoserine kinase [Paenibacillus mangrovi]MCJ8014572.1 homoserine kinase [Paenibacillus mangrovi]
MAVKTEFTNEEFKQLFHNYQLGDFIEATPIKEGTVQTNYKIRTSKGIFIFRYYESRSVNSVLFETDVLHYLKNNNYPSPYPYRNNSGSFVGVYHSKPYVVSNYIEGHHMTQELNEQQKSTLIQKAAELHKLTQNYSPMHKESRWNYNVDFCLEQAEQRINSLNGKKKLMWLENVLRNLDLPESLPMGICHSDFHISNILYQNDEFVALLDFDDANYTYLLFDLVGLMESWAWTHDKYEVLNLTEAKKVVQEYMKFRPLSSVEKKHLFDVYKLSICIDCLWFWDRGDAEDFYEKRKIDYLDHLGREKFYHELFH